MSSILTNILIPSAFLAIAIASFLTIAVLSCKAAAVKGEGILGSLFLVAISVFGAMAFMSAGFFISTFLPHSGVCDTAIACHTQNSIQELVALRYTFLLRAFIFVLVAYGLYGVLIALKRNGKLPGNGYKSFFRIG